MAAGKTRMTIRFSDEAYRILMKIHPSIRTDVLSDIVVKAEKRGWIDEVKQKQVEKVLEGIGMTIDDVAAIKSGIKTPKGENLPADKTGRIHRLVPEATGREESLQEKLDKNIFL